MQFVLIKLTFDLTLLIAAAKFVRACEVEDGYFQGSLPRL